MYSENSNCVTDRNGDAHDGRVVAAADWWGAREAFWTLQLIMRWADGCIPCPLAQWHASKAACRRVGDEQGLGEQAALDETGDQLRGGVIAGRSTCIPGGSPRLGQGRPVSAVRQCGSSILSGQPGWLASCVS